MNRKYCFVIIALVLLSGCGTKSVVPNYEAADEFILYSIDGSEPRFAPPAGAEVFRGIEVL